MPRALKYFIPCQNNAEYICMNKCQNTLPGNEFDCAHILIFSPETSIWKKKNPHLLNYCHIISTCFLYQLYELLPRAFWIILVYILVSFKIYIMVQIGSNSNIFHFHFLYFLNVFVKQWHHYSETTLRDYTH